MIKLAVATCRSLPDWEVDDVPFYEALRERGVDLELVNWDDDVRWADYSACLIRTTWDYMERREAFVDWATEVERHIPLWNPARVLDWNTDKRYLRDLEVRGVPIAPTLWLDRGQRYDVPLLMAEQGWRRGFIKPRVGATARETLRFDLSEHQLAADHLERVLRSEDMMMQPYFGSVESEGEISLLYFAGVLSHAVQKIPVNGDYRVQDDFGARDFPVQADEAMVAIADRAIERAMAICGESQPLIFARADFLRDLNGDWVINELELVEPSLFLRHSESAPGRLADAVVERLGRL